VLKEYQWALEDLNEVHVLEPNNAFTLIARGQVKKMLKDYQGALEDLKTKFMFLTKQCIHFDSSWTGQKDVERLSRSLGRSQDKFHVLDQTMHSL